ncbi:MAG: SOS response-associated peptidase [Acidobacteriota bacterium]|nr:SOS response-associated peptidase [Acidobacteriota bacterium]
MCGRFTLTSPASVLASLFEIEPPAGLAPRYNIAPSQDVLAVRRTDEEQGREAALVRWGLIPGWAKDPSIGNRLINARSETAAEKPSFRAAMRRRRCLIPADGFYEWAALEGSAKRPYLIRLSSGEPFALAGLWERWQPDDAEPVESCTILTTTANESLARLHGRMPVIIEPAEYDRWLLARGRDGPLPSDLLVPFPADRMTFHEVSRVVNSPRNDDPSCIEPIDGGAAPEQPSLPLTPE